MFKKILMLTCLSVSFSANAALIDNGNFTSDSISGLDWLDLSFTNNTSYNQVVSETASGGIFDGWTVASRTQLYNFFDNAGGDGSYQDTNNSIVISTLYPLWGQMAYSANTSWFHYLDVTPGGNTSGMSIKQDSYIYDYPNGFSTPSFAYNNIGTALVRSSAVPEPSTIWLLASALIGFFSLNRKKLKNRTF